MTSKSSQQDLVPDTVVLHHPAHPLWQWWQHLRLALALLWLTLCFVPDMLIECFHLISPRRRKRVLNEVVMVTGAGRGLGRGLCLKFAALGADLVCVDVDAVGNEETARKVRQLGARARTFHCNVAARAEVVKLAEEVGRVDILVNNAGVYPHKGLWNATEEELRSVVYINLMSQMWTVQAFLPGMKSRDHGHVVCVASMAALVGLPDFHPYAAAKAGLIGLMNTLRVELQQERTGRKLKLTTVFPYFVKTNPEISAMSEKCKLPALEVDAAVDDIFDGILEERSSFSVPRYMARWHRWIEVLPERYGAKMFAVAAAVRIVTDADDKQQ